ncbi:lytic murein transglycosylase [Streptomyces sp. ID05-04B]|uniref:lytic transglycosylase domain-containing protein n=1 Tax=unclassified Streptomyces TaxID=2593676 RepID=UPI000D1A3B8D|nr:MULTISPECIES: lytic transglycosylase domain-containing protein [unclassified Streptomyces]AVV43230.1 lytic transglycosylase [Streptomyces sp. P3]MDX5570562.1 lytic murein transglycosylase [Streptomyces sp. ID05-04B]
MSAHFGTRLRKGAVNTTVAALAVAALAASQAPDVTADTQGRRTAADTPATETGTDAGTDDSATGNSPYYTDLPPLHSPNPAPTQSSATPPAGGGEAGIPATVLDAYKKAEAQLAQAKPGCNLPWQLLAAIGKVESGQARGGNVTADGTTVSPILGPVLNGSGFANIRDTDNGAYDGDRTFDRAVGPMQFIPSTWAWAGRDGNADGKKDPNNIYDAALAAGHYLCRYGWDMSTTSGMRTAILSYNNSTDYLNTVLSWLEYYRKGSHGIPDGTGTVPTDRSDDYTPTSPSVPTTPGRPSVPSTPGKPTRPSTPGKPTKPSTPGKPTPTPTPAPTPTETVHHLEAAGPAKITAMAGNAYTDRVSARAETAAGKAVAKVRIRFTIVGDTDAEFTGGESVATIVTDSRGIALAPVLRAGEKSGAFTVRATVLGRTLSALDYAATVTPRAADVLARTGDTALTCTVGGEFADAVEVKATYKGAAAGKVAATATLVKSASDPTANDKGPYFKGAGDSPVRTLDLQTDADGLLRLPQLYAGDTAGAYLLRITTTGGAVLTVELTVTAAGTSAPAPAPVESEPEPEATASAS